MRELLVIVIPALAMFAISERNSTYKLGELGEKVYIKKEKWLYIIATVSMAIFVGLRTSYNDTEAYIYSYSILGSDFINLFEIDWNIGNNPGFTFINTCMKIAGWSSQDYIMFYAIITICINLWFIRKYSENIWLSIFFYITMGCYTFSMAAIKQTVAMALCLLATDRFIENKKIQFIFWTIIAALVHPYALMYLVLPLLSFNPWTMGTYFMILAFGLAGIGLEALLGTIINVTTLMGEEYTTESLRGDGVNVFRLAVVWVPVLLSLIANKLLKNSNDKVNNILINLATLNAEVMFIGLFGTANYFARLANYFLIFQAVALPSLFKYYNERSKKILIIGAIVGYSLYFFYAEAIANGSFDMLFYRMTLMEYIQSVFK